MFQCSDRILKEIGETSRKSLGKIRANHLILV